MMQLSGGEKQKIACAGVSIMKPDIFVLDEPSSNLDAASIMDLRRIIAHWKEQGKTIIITEHRLYYLRGLADRILILHIRMVHRFYISENVRFRQIGLSQLRAIMELENLLFPVVSVVWKNNVAQSSGMEKLTDQKKG